MRILLKFILQLLSKAAIHKHNIRIVVVNGWVGVDVLKEGIYCVLEDKFIIRRNIKPVWWDLSIPLNILGYEDKVRDLSQWIILIMKAIVVLIFAPKNPHILIISAHSNNSQTGKYWSSFIRPELLVIINSRRDSSITKNLIKSTLKNSGIIIYNANTFTTIPKENSYTYGQTKGNIIYTRDRDFICLNYVHNIIKFKNQCLSPYEPELLAATFAAAIKMDMSLDDIVTGLSRFDYRNIILSKIIKSI